MDDHQAAALTARQREAAQIAAWLRGMPHSPAFSGWGWRVAYTLFGGYWHALCDLIERRTHAD